MKQLDYKEVECIKLSHLSEEQKKAYILVHNKLTMNTGFDIALLNEELEQIENIDMEDFDFVTEELANINIDDFLADMPTKEKKPKTAICPHCGEEFEI